LTKLSPKFGTTVFFGTQGSYLTATSASVSPHLYNLT